MTRDRMSAKGEKRTSAYSMTASARRRKDSGILSPNALAVVRLMTSSNTVGCSRKISWLGAREDSVDSFARVPGTGPCCWLRKT